MNQEPVLSSSSIVPAAITMWSLPEKKDLSLWEDRTYFGKHFSYFKNVPIRFRVPDGSKALCCQGSKRCRNTKVNWELKISL